MADQIEIGTAVKRILAFGHEQDGAADGPNIHRSDSERQTHNEQQLTMSDVTLEQKAFS